jgi:hypothetical protein
MSDQSPAEPDGEPDYYADMRLPEGITCDDCRHAKRCFGMGFSEAGRTSCDFWPSRFGGAQNVD